RLENEAGGFIKKLKHENFVQVLENLNYVNIVSRAEGQFAQNDMVFCLFVSFDGDLPEFVRHDFDRDHTGLGNTIVFRCEVWFALHLIRPLAETVKILNQMIAVEHFARLDLHLLDKLIDGQALCPFNDNLADNRVFFDHEGDHDCTLRCQFHLCLDIFKIPEATNRQTVILKISLVGWEPDSGLGNRPLDYGCIDQSV